MKVKKLVSKICSVLIASTMLMQGIVAVSHADEYADPITNLAVGGDMEGENFNAYVPFTGQSMSYVSECGNKVLYVDNTNNSGGTSMLIPRMQLLPGRNYYYKFRARTAAGSYQIWLQYLNKGVSIQRSEYTTVSGTYTNTATANRDLRVFMLNQPKVNYYIDDMYIYDITDAVDLTVPSSVKIISGAEIIDGSLKANKNSLVSFTVDNSDIIVSSVKIGDEIISQTDGVYTFVMPETAAEITVEGMEFEESLKNLSVGGMEDIPEGVISNGSDDNFSNPYVKTGSSISYKKDGASTVLCYDSTQALASWATSLLYIKVPIKNGHRYEYSFKGKILYPEGSTAYTVWMETAAKGFNNQPSGNSYTEVSETLNATADSSVFNMFVQNQNSAKYYIDDIYFYDVTNAVNLTAPDSVQFISGAENVKDQLMANKGSLVRFSLDLEKEEIKSVTVGGVPVSDVDGVYTVVMPNEAATIVVDRYPEALKNLSAGNLENMPIGEVSGARDSYFGDPYAGTNGRKMSYLKDNGNTVVCLDATATTDTTSWPSAFDFRNSFVSGHRYCFSFKAKMVSPASNQSFWLNSPVTSDVASVLIKTTWSNYVKEFTASANKTELRMNNTQGNGQAKYYLDDVYLYDVTNAVDITAPSEVEFISGAENVNGQLKANKGSIVKFRVNSAGEEIEAVKLGNTVLEPVDGVYTITMPNEASEIVVETKIVFENLIPDGDMQGDISRFKAAMTYDSSVKHYLSTVPYTEDSEDKYLLFDASQNTTTWARSTFDCYVDLKAGHKYFYSLKARTFPETAEIVGNSGFNLWLNYANKSIWINKDNFSQYTGTFTQASDLTYLRLFAQSAQNQGYNYSFAIDDYKLYDITEAIKVSFETDGYVVAYPSSEDEHAYDVMDNTVYAEPGAVINFKIDKTDPAKTIIAPDLTYVGNGIYTYTVGEADANIEIKAVEDISYAIDGGNIDVTAREAGNRKIIAAKYANGTLTKVFVANANTTEANQTVTVATNFESLDNVNIYCWDSLDSMVPLRRAYKKMTATPKVFLAGDSTCVEYTAGELQGWGYYFKDLLEGAQTVNVSKGGATIASFLDNSAQYNTLTSEWEEGDYLLISFGINDRAQLEIAEYRTKIASLVDAAKAQGLNVILIKEQDTLNLRGNDSYVEFIDSMDTIGAQKNVPVIDLYSATVSMPDYCRASDGIHINKFGAAYIAETVAVLLNGIDSELKYFVK